MIAFRHYHIALNKHKWKKFVDFINSKSGSIICNVGILILSIILSSSTLTPFHTFLILIEDYIPHRKDMPWWEHLLYWLSSFFLALIFAFIMLFPGFRLAIYVEDNKYEMAGWKRWRYIMIIIGLIAFCILSHIATEVFVIHYIVSYKL